MLTGQTQQVPHDDSVQQVSHDGSAQDQTGVVKAGPVRWYAAIDLKSFYASVECVERGLDPLAARLLVADYTRTDKTICLAVSPALKEALGVPGRVRLYEVLQKARARGVDFEAAPPRMRKYLEVSRQIYQIYLKFVAPEDIFSYSIDEVFIDVTDYLTMYGCDAVELARRMVRAVFNETGITATAGVGVNLYLAKIAMDVKAKHMPADADGARVAELDEETYRRELWNHQPITDFWRVGPGYARRLKSLGIHTMGELARYSMVGAEKLYHVFGVNAELLIDHAWGYEPVTMREVKAYRSNNHSVNSGQVLHRAYTREEAALVAWEMAEALALDLFEKNLVTDQLVLYIGYDKHAPGYTGEKVRDHYGREVPKPTRATINLPRAINNQKVLADVVRENFLRLCFSDLMVRRIMISACHVKQRENGKNHENKIFQADLFTDYEKLAREDAKMARLMQAEIAIKKRYGKNAILKAANYEEAATMRERNHQVGGHKA
ncbi:DNA methylase [Candidatus Saccharibacteria bacterium]|nr:DNA methylase [Candidatus Saccharibacteria bacterium]